MHVYGCGINLEGNLIENGPELICCPTFLCTMEENTVLEKFNACYEASDVPQDLENILDHDEQFMQILYGNEHAVGLMSDGQVYTWGNGMRGQLGLSDMQSCEKPHEVTLLQGLNIVDISVGSWHSMALSSDGDVYAWGWNESGQLGLPNDKLTSPNIPDLPTSFQWQCKCPKSEIASQYVVNHLVNEEKSPITANVQAVPCLIDYWTLDTRIKKVQCGSRHTFFLLENGSVWGVGWNKYGQVGTGCAKENTSLQCLNVPKAKDIVVKHWNSFIICEDTI